MNCCDYDCHQGRDCPARSTLPDEILMSHTTFAIHGHTVTVTGPKAGELAKRIRCAEQAHQARMQYLAMPSLYARDSVATQSQARASMAPQITGKPTRARRVLRFLRNPWTIALGLTAATWTASVLLVSKAIGA